MLQSKRDGTVQWLKDGNSGTVGIGSQGGYGDRGYKWQLGIDTACNKARQSGDTEEVRKDFKILGDVNLGWQYG